MKVFSFSAMLAILFFVQNVSGQNLPNAMYFVESEHTLYTNGRVSEGTYDESQLKDWHLWFSQADYWQQLKNNYQNIRLILQRMK